MSSTTVSDLWTNFHSGATRPYAWRIRNLKKFKAMINENMDIIKQSLIADLNQSDPMPHLFVCLREVEFMISNLQSLMRSKSVTSDISFVNFPSRGEISPEPVGPVLVIGTWNYPYHSALGAVPAAIAAGNPVCVKPGTLCESSTRVMTELIGKYFASNDIACIIGDVDIVTELLNEYSWGHIFFTGGTRIGKIVATAAAKRLIPVTLELGGKNPTIVTKSAEIPLAARRIAWGKWASNAGQVCIAPDHVLVDESVADELVAELKKCLEKFFPAGNLDGYCKIISMTHVERLRRIIDLDRSTAVSLFEYGVSDFENRVIAPVMLDFGSDFKKFDSSAAMGEEIFGPILPIVRYTDIGECREYVTRKTREANPLAFYIFSRDSRNVIRRQFLDNCPSGAVVVNDTGMHIVEGSLPFGGIGSSGIGQYHGEKSFEKFTHYRPVLWKNGWMDIPFRYPPVGGSGGRIIRALLWMATNRITPVRVGKVLLILGLLWKIFKH
jgi:aldehyde dehydrogenase (NAD+)